MLGTMAGTGSALALFLLISAAGARGTTRDAILIFVQFLALFTAGYVAGRVGGGLATLDGGLAGLLTFFVSVALSLAAGGSLGSATILFLGVVAAVLGSAGGVLAQFMRGR